MSSERVPAASTDRRTVLKALSASSAALVGTTTLSGTAAAITDPSDVSASLYDSQESNYSQSSYQTALVRIYQTDGHGMSELQTVMSDVASFVDQISPLDGWRVELYETNISGFFDCLDSDGCDPYLHGREYVYELGHHEDGGGNVFIHPNPDGDGANEGGTFGGPRHDNYITMPSYNTPDRGPISIKGSETRHSYCEGRGVYWAACHELGHQFLGSSDWWSSDYGTDSCGDSGRDSHYLATNVYPCYDAYSYDLKHHTIMGQYQYLTECGQCSDSASPDYASLNSSTCFDDATQDCINYAENNL